MLGEVEFMSQHQAERIDGCSDVLFISIRSPGQRVALKLGHADVLPLEFDDWDPQRDGMGASRIVTAFSDEMAAQLERWLSHYESQSMQYRVLVHCHAGVSRSAAIAWWIHKTYCTNLKTALMPQYMNRYVLKILNPSLAPSNIL